MIDVHCHLEQNDFDMDRERVIQRCRRELDAVITSSVVPGDLGLTMGLVRRHGGFVFASAGLHPEDVERVSMEEVKFDGEDITEKRLDQLVRKGIGYLTQIDNVFTDLTVKENLEMGGYTTKSSQIRSSMRELFNIFPELAHNKDRKANTLSGEERQRLALARALITNPKLLLLDEPTSNLDPKAVTSFYKKIEEINGSGVSILIAEQNVKKALQISDRTYILVSGRLIYSGKSEKAATLDMREIFFTPLQTLIPTQSTN